MQYSDIDEWLESISLENAHTIFREIELSFVNLTQKLTNMSLKEKLPLPTPKIYKSLCQNSQSKTIVKTTMRPSKLGQLLCQKNKQDPSIKRWLDQMVFNQPNSSCNFEDLPMSIRKNNKKVKHKSQLRLFMRSCKTPQLSIKNPISWNELDRQIRRRPRAIYDDPYDGNTKNTLMKVMKTNEYSLLNGGTISPLISIFIQQNSDNLDKFS